MNRVTLGVLGTFVVILLLSGVLAYFSRERTRSAATPGTTSTVTTEQASESNENPILSQLFGPDAGGLVPSAYARWEATAARISLRF